MSARLSEADYAALSGGKVTKPSKYRSVAVIVTEDGLMLNADEAKARKITGRRFASKAEGRRYCELRMLERAGTISELECQPKFILHGIDGRKIAAYVGDFKFFDLVERAVVVEDVKSKPTMTRTYRMKRALLEAEYGVQIREVC